MTWQSDWKGLGGGFLFGSDEIKPLPVLHLFQRDCLLSSLMPEAHCRFQEQYQLLTIIDQFITTGSLSSLLELFPGEMTFLGLSYPAYFAFWKSWCCTHPLSAQSCQIEYARNPEEFAGSHLMRDQRPPLAGGSADTQPCGLGGDKCWLQRVTDMLDVEEHQHMFQGSWCISYPLLKHAQVSRSRGPGHSEDVRSSQYPHFYTCYPRLPLLTRKPHP